MGDEFRRTQKDKSPKIKSVKLQQRKHEAINKYIIVMIYYSYDIETQQQVKKEVKVMANKAFKFRIYPNAEQKV
ncbi:MAG: helix-turn-helix domain-containing protein, partial [Allobaculum sp.]|nr:helix-turn-helix domain-containing protein [Allobaculum sp.]